MKSNSKAQTERIGVAAAQLAFRELGWIFREQSVEDYGIDAQIELVVNEIATGRLIALQIKSGNSWFKEKTNDGFVFRGENNHLKYWIEHSLPVLIILYNKQEKTLYWQFVDQGNVQATEKAWKIVVPFNQRVDERSNLNIREICENIPMIRRHTILESSDVSHVNARRYRVNLLINGGLSKAQIKSELRKIHFDLRLYGFYQKSNTKGFAKKREVDVIWTFIYLSLEDVGSANWFCRTQWVSSKLSSKFRPLSISGENIGDQVEEIIVDWNENYVQMSAFLRSIQEEKKDYLENVIEATTRIKSLVQKYVSLFISIDQEVLLSTEIEHSSLTKLSQISSDIKIACNLASDIGLPPFECQSLNEQFNCFVSMAYNIALPFSEDGLKTWTRRNGYFLTRQSIRDYQTDLQKLEFELDRIR